VVLESADVIANFRNGKCFDDVEDSNRRADQPFLKVSWVIHVTHNSTIINEISLFVHRPNSTHCREASTVRSMPTSTG